MAEFVEKEADEVSSSEDDGVSGDERNETKRLKDKKNKKKKKLKKVASSDEDDGKHLQSITICTDELYDNFCVYPVG